MQPIVFLLQTSYSFPLDSILCVLHFLCCVMQHEISLDAYNRLTSTPDAEGRTIQVTKGPVPYPLFRTYKEANGVHVSALTALAGSSCCQVGCVQFCLGKQEGLTPSKPVNQVCSCYTSTKASLSGSRFAVCTLFSSERSQKPIAHRREHCANSCVCKQALISECCI